MTKIIALNSARHGGGSLTVYKHGQQESVPKWNQNILIAKDEIYLDQMIHCRGVTVILYVHAVKHKKKIMFASVQIIEILWDINESIKQRIDH